MVGARSMLAIGWSTEPIAERVSIPVYWFMVRIFLMLEKEVLVGCATLKLGNVEDIRWGIWVVTFAEGVEC